MPANLLAIKKLYELFDPREARAIVKMSKEIEDNEAHWRHLLTGFFKNMTEEVINKLVNDETLIADDLSFDDFFMRHFFETTMNAIHQTQSPTAQTIGRLAKTPKGKVTGSLKDLMRIWDLYRKTGKMPPRQRTIVNRVRRDYLDKVKSVWERYSEPFRIGNNQDKQDIVDKIRKASQSQYARSKTIVETETTRYYNQVRKDIYDKSPDVTHYLYMAIRDMRTTKWCKTRHELVYTKGTEFLERETPPCFLGHTPILTLEGWKRIDCIGIADYVWTHENRWRRVKEVHRTHKKLVELLQIGSAMATTNHPYFETGRGFVEAIEFRPSQGLWTGSLNLSRLFKASLDAMVQAGPKILFKSLSRYFVGSYSEKRRTSIVEGWTKSFKVRIHRDSNTGTSESEQAGLCLGTCCYCREDVRKTSLKGGSCSPHQRNKKRQSRAKSSSNDSRSSYFASQTEVFNLEVDQDNTYIAGGYLVHNCHWNCRSEILPLTPLNPRHKKIIEDLSRRRENRHPEPLPKGWNAG